MDANYTVDTLPVESITVEAIPLTLEPMETDNERHARLIETAKRKALTPGQVADHIIRRTGK